MTTLSNLQMQQGAQLAPDGVPLHFGDIAAEYDAATHHAVVMDRSHEGRIQLTGADRLEIMHRISTNDLHNMRAGEGRGTVFTNATARIIDRVMVYNCESETLLLTEPGRGEAMTGFLQRKIFFNDDAQIRDITANTRQFVLHGKQTDNIVRALDIAPDEILSLHGVETQIADVPVFVARRERISGNHWSIIVLDAAQAHLVWRAITDVEGIVPAGALAFNMIRIRSGRPAFGRELSSDYIPLEVGLWDEVSFTKGCYTGQEIIARMESRNQLAKVMVRLKLEAPTQTPNALIQAGKSVGTLTSCVEATNGDIFGIGVVKTTSAKPDTTLQLSNGTSARIVELAAAAPPVRMIQRSKA